MSQEGRKVTLKCGEEVLIRRIGPADFDQSMRFFSGLSDEDREYLRVDVMDPEVVMKRLESYPLENMIILGAFQGDRLVADATLRWPKAGWMAHVGEVRIMIAEDFRRRGLASVLYRELFIQAVRAGLEKVDAFLIAEQISARKCMEKLGFTEEGVLPKFVKDMHGNLHDLIIMSVSIGGI